MEKIGCPSARLLRYNFDNCLIKNDLFSSKNRTFFKNNYSQFIRNNSRKRLAHYLVIRLHLPYRYIFQCILKFVNLISPGFFSYSPYIVPMLMASDRFGSLLEINFHSNLKSRIGKSGNKTHCRS